MTRIIAFAIGALLAISAAAHAQETSVVKFDNGLVITFTKPSGNVYYVAYHMPGNLLASSKLMTEEEADAASEAAAKIGIVADKKIRDSRAWREATSVTINSTEGPPSYQIKYHLSNGVDLRSNELLFKKRAEDLLALTRQSGIKSEISKF